MLKKLLVELIVMLVVTFSVGSIFAENVRLSEKVNLGVNCSAVLPTEKDAGTGIYVGGLLSYDVLKYLAIGVESGYGQIDSESNSIKLGTLRVVPLLGDVIVKVPIEMDKFSLTPYGIVGAGVVFPAFSESDIVKYVGLSIETDTAFAMRFGGGVDFKVTKNIVLNFEVSYLMSDIDTKANWKGQTLPSDSLKADSWLVGGGVKVSF